MSTQTFIAAASFEDRSVHWVKEFLNKGGTPDQVFLADVVERHDAYTQNLAHFSRLGIEKGEQLDRFSSATLWSWVVSVVNRTSDTRGDLTIDITCMPRELLGMLLFSISVKRDAFNSISIVYVSAPEGGYATQNFKLPEKDRWLSKGVASIRSIVGYPGVFHSERPCRLVVLAGHEKDRIAHLVEHVEPKWLTISGEREHSSTVPGGREISEKVAKTLKSRIQLPVMDGIEFSSSSIDEVYRTLMDADLGGSEENVALSAMNTKLSFVGAALFALSNRAVRMMYAVPREYNPLYCQGVGQASRVDITDLVSMANT